MRDDSFVSRDARPDSLDDADYVRLIGLIPAPKRNGRPRERDVRPVLNALHHKVRTNCSWRRLPAPPQFPPWPTVYGYYRLFMEAGVWPAMRQLLLRADDHCPDRPAKPFKPRSPEELRAVLTKVERVRNHAVAVSEQARLTLAVRKKFAKEAAERLRRMRVPEI